MQIIRAWWWYDGRSIGKRQILTWHWLPIKMRTLKWMACIHRRDELLCGLVIYRFNQINKTLHFLNYDGIKIIIFNCVVKLTFVVIELGRDVAERTNYLSIIRPRPRFGRLKVMPWTWCQRLMKIIVVVWLSIRYMKLFG